jgi:hypothetical protein
VITVYQADSKEAWLKALRDVGVSESARWSNYWVSGSARDELLMRLGMKGYVNQSYLVDPAGCVVHSGLNPVTMIPVIEGTLRERERCTAGNGATFGFPPMAADQ